MPFSSRPPYIYPGGSMMMHAPFEQQNSMMFGFFLKGDIQKLQRLCDQQLNAVAQGRFRFEPLTNYVMLTFTKINKDFSLHPADRAKGWGQEIDTSIWIPVGQYKIENNQKILQHIHWIMPYIWVDHPMTIINGREIFGYPKYLGRFEMPMSPDNADHFSLDVNAFKTYSPDTEATWGRVLEVNRMTHDSPAQNANQWNTWAEFAVALFSGISNLDDFILTDGEIDKQIIQGLLSPQLPQLFLKQFPDGTGERAVYQALTTSPAVINGFHGAGLLWGQYQFTLHEFASEPIAQDLGLVVGDQLSALSFWVNFDFSIQPPKELVNNSIVEKQKIAVLGGGVSAMTAVYAITSLPDWKSRYDITLYQMGWRLGGKGASGRNAAMGQRIEEHGLHIWFGFYENAFKVMQDCYAELDRPTGAPLRTWEEAFHPQSFVLVDEFINDKWEIWPFDFPLKPGVPGDGEESPSLWNVTQTLYAWVKQEIEKIVEEITGLDTYRPQKVSSDAGFTGLLNRFADRIQRPIEHLASNGLSLLSQLSEWTTLDDKLLQADDNELVIDTLIKLKGWIEKLVEEFIEDNAILRRLYIAADLGLTVLKGMFEDQVFTQGFSAINDIEFRAWLTRHGANPLITVNSAPVRALYDLVFAYEDGDINRPNIEAGTCLSGALRILFCYKGGIMWKMQAGMGDVVFTPLYEVLKARGVNFEFFHKVVDIEPDTIDPSRVGKIRLCQQVSLLDTEYNPLIDVKGLPCWPSEPDYSQIEPTQAQLLKSASINLESSWTDWPSVYEKAFGNPLPEITLNVNVDFDLVIFGLSVASVPITCSKLLEKSAPLRDTVAHVKTVVTQAYQLWLNEDLNTLGWRIFPDSGEEPVLTSFTEPLDTWASMGQLLCREDWPADKAQPKSLAYFCGVQAIYDFPPFNDHNFPEQCRTKVRAAAVDQLNQSIYWLWPNTKTSNGFQWESLYAPNTLQGEQRFDAQYWRSNIDPSERYVLSVTNSTKFRLATDATGFSNLFVTGDWIKNGINAGCVEGAVQSGLQTSRAICGYPKMIKGEKDFA